MRLITCLVTIPVPSLCLDLSFLFCVSCLKMSSWFSRMCSLEMSEAMFGGNGGELRCHPNLSQTPSLEWMFWKDWFHFWSVRISFSCLRAPIVCYTGYTCGGSNYSSSGPKEGKGSLFHASLFRGELFGVWVGASYKNNPRFFGRGGVTPSKWRLLLPRWDPTRENSNPRLKFIWGWH